MGQPHSDPPGRAPRRESAPISAAAASLKKKKKKARRPAARDGACACHLAADIGAYNSCPHLCRYCYANADPAAVAANARRHDPASPLLLGRPEPGDTIREAKQESWLDGQMRFD